MIDLKKERGLGFFAAAVSVIEGSNQFFDYVMYPAVIAWLGAVRGGIFMTIVALVINYLVVIWYNKTKHDWFGLEWLELQETMESPTLFGKIVRVLSRFGKWPTFVALSIYNPPYGFIFLRGRNSKGYNLSSEDWFWYFVSNIIGNVVWILGIVGVFASIRSII